MEGSLFARLPGEVRNQIYDLVYPPPAHEEEDAQSTPTNMAILVKNLHDLKLMSNHGHQKHMGLVQTCRQIRTEVGPVKPLAGRKFNIHLVGYTYYRSGPNSKGLPALSFLAAYLKHLGGDALRAIETLVLDVKYGYSHFTLQRSVVDGKVMILYSAEDRWSRTERAALYNVVVEAYKEAGVDIRPCADV